MSILIQHLYLFLFGAFGGWLLEVGFRSLKAKKLVNPGFLSGPYLPLYGFGMVILHLFCKIDYSFINNGTLQVLLYAGMVTAALTTAELAAGLILRYGLKIKLWDYSNMRFNFKGIICPQFTIFWGLLGIGYYYLINPWLADVVLKISNNLFAVLALGIVCGIFLYDLYETLGIVIKIRHEGVKMKAIINYELLKSAYKKSTRLDGPNSARLQSAIVESHLYKSTSHKRYKAKKRENKD